MRSSTHSGGTKSGSSSSGTFSLVYAGVSKDDPAFNQKLLRRFINLIGLFPIGTLVRLNTEEIGVVTHEHPTDPFRPQVKIVRDRDGGELEEMLLVNTWEPETEDLDGDPEVLEEIEER